MLSVGILSCSDGDAGLQGLPGEQGERGVPAPLISSNVDLSEFVTLSEDFESGNDLNVTMLTPFAPWQTEVFLVEEDRSSVITGNTIIRIDNNNIVEIDNSSLLDDIRILNQFSGNVVDESSSTLFFSGDVNDDENSSVDIMFNNIESNSVLLFDAYISSESNFDFLRWSINDELIEGISGITDQDRNGMFGQPFKVAIPLSVGNNKLTLAYTKDFSISTGLDAGAIDNLQVIDFESYLELIETLEDNTEISKKLNSDVVLLSNKLNTSKSISK